MNIFFKKLKSLFFKSKPETPKTLVEQTVDFLNRCPPINDDAHKSLGGYVGDIRYYRDGNKKVYFNDGRIYFCDYNTKNPSKEVLCQMIKETTFTEEEFKKEIEKNGN